MDREVAALEKCKDYGYMHMGEWDLLWSITAKAMLAAEILRPGERLWPPSLRAVNDHSMFRGPSIPLAPMDAIHHQPAAGWNVHQLLSQPPCVSLAGQMVDIIPGFLCITRKTSLVRSLRTVYGDACAFTIVPQTFKLPEELDDWAGGDQDLR